MSSVPIRTGTHFYQRGTWGAWGSLGSSISLRNLKAIQLVIRLYADFSNFLHIVFNEFKSLKHKNICRTWAQWLIPVILGD